MRPLSQEEIDRATDKRGVIAPDIAKIMRDTRASEVWERYDTVIIGQGANNLSRGWFPNWAAFANADRISWFSGRDTSVGEAYTNQESERTDWAQDLFRTHVELIVPPGMADYDTDNNDADIMQMLFVQDLPNKLALRVVLAESDEIAKAPASHFGAGYGTTFPVVSGAASPTTIGGVNGDAHVSNGWVWPEPVMLAAKAKITVYGYLNDPLKAALRALPGPGTMLIPDGQGGTVEMPKWYGIRITHVGPRYVQLRGARSSA